MLPFTKAKTGPGAPRGRHQARLPRQEIDLLLLTVLRASGLAEAGDAAAGHACLAGGVHYAEKVAATGAPWGTELLEFYDRELSSYLDHYRMAPPVSARGVGPAGEVTLADSAFHDTGAPPATAINAAESVADPLQEYDLWETAGEEETTPAPVSTGRESSAQRGG